MTDRELIQQILETVKENQNELAEVKAGQTVLQDNITSLQKDIKTIKSDVKKIKFGDSVFHPWVDEIDLRQKKVEEAVGL